jgi:hypothetical protein
LGDQHSFREISQDFEKLLVQVRDYQLTQKSSLLTVNEEDAPGHCRYHVDVEKDHEVVPIFIDPVFVADVVHEVKEIPPENDQAR